VIRRLGISIRAPLGHENSSHTTSSIRSVFQTLSEAEQESLKSAIRADEEEEMRALANFNQRYKGRRGLEKRSQTVFETTSNPTSDYSSSSSHSYSSSDLSTLSSLTPEASNSTFGYSLILSPVGGQVVYLRSYEIPIVPISGAGKSLNNEKGLSLQIRDEFGFVYQIFGISPLKVGVKEGDLISRGQFLGGISKRPLSDTPLSRRKPADLPKNVRDSPSKAKYYPFRYRELRLNVARPSSEWKEWKEPYAKGWQYFNPLNFLSKGKFESRIPPYGNPNEIFFATPPGSNGEAISSSFIPHAFASSKDFLTPTLTGRVELITGFESFFQTPGEVEDGMDGLAVHRMDWGLVRKVSNTGKKRNKNSNSDLEIKDQSCRVEEHEKVDWRLSFEHHKVSLKVRLLSYFPRSLHLTASACLFASFQFPLDPLSTPKSSLNSGSLSTFNSSTRSLSHPSTLLLRSNFLPAFSTGLIFKSYQTSQFDEKSRHLLYSPTRNVRGSSALGVNASWDTRDTRDGDYELLIRAKDWWGNEGCVRSKIRVRNL